MNGESEVSTETETSGEFNLHEAADELISNETQASSTGKAQEDGQSEKTPTEPISDEQKALDALNGKADEVSKEASPGASNALLEQVNALGMIHNGQGIKLESADQLKELIQKGYDYTKKTMAHSEEVKKWQEESAKLNESYQQREQEILGTTFKNRMVDEMVDEWKDSDPELYEYIQAAFQRKITEFQKNQPVIAQYEGKFKELENKLAQFEQGKQQEQLKGIKEGWDKELGELQTNRSARLKQLGIVPNWEKVKEVWSSDNSNTMTAEKALLAVYGADMIKAMESETSRLKKASSVQSSKLSRGGVASSQKGNINIAARSGDYMSILNQAVNQI